MAEKENIYGIKYEVDIEELKSSTKEASQQIKLANSEFKKSTAGMDNWSKSTDGLSAKLKQLNSILEAEKTKLESLKNDYNGQIEKIEEYDGKIAGLQKQKEQAIAQYGKESKEVKSLETEIEKLSREQQASKETAVALTISINNQEAAVGETQKEIRNYNAKLGELQAEQNKTASATDKLKSAISEQEAELQDLKSKYTSVVLEQGKTSDEAKKLAAKMRELNGDLAQSKSKLSEAEKQADSLIGALNDTGESAESSSGGFTVMKGALANLVANGITAAVSKAGELVGALFDLSEATAEYRSMNAKLEGSATSFGYEIDFAKEKYKEFYGYLKDDQMATNAITNLMGLGLETKNLDGLINGAISTWSAYGDSIPIEALTESIAESINVSKITGSLADTINWASLSNEKWNQILGQGSAAQKAFNSAKAEGLPLEDAFNAALAETSTQQERANLVAGLLNTTFGESKKKYDELNGSMTEANRAELELKDTQAQLGAAVEPVNTAFTNLKTQALDLLAPGVEFLSQKFLELMTYLQEHPAVMNLLLGIVIALTTAFGVLAVALGIQALISGVTKAIALLNTTMLANPIMLVVAAIAGLVAGFIYLWNTSEGFRNFWIGLWNGLVSITQTVVTAIVTFFTVTVPGALSTFAQGVSNVVTSVSQFFQNLWQNIVNFFMVTIPSWISNAINFFMQLPNYIGYMIGFIIGKFIAWGQNLVQFVTSDIPNFISRAVSFFGQLPGLIWNHLSNVISRTASWVSQMASKAIQAGSQFISNAISYISQLPGRIASSLSSAISRAASFAVSLGQNGLEAGTKLLNNVVNAVKSLPSKMTSIGKDVVRGLWNGINDMIDWVVGRVKSFGNSVMSGIKSALGINSPSKITYYFGQMVDMGLGNAIEDGAGKVAGKARSMASGVLGAMKDKLKEKVSVGFEVVDGLKAKAWGTISNLTMQGGGARIAYAAGTSVNNISFNQYNTSPKPLDSLEVYRQTRRQLKLLEKWRGKK